MSNTARPTSNPNPSSRNRPRSTSTSPTAKNTSAQDSFTNPSQSQVFLHGLLPLAIIGTLLCLTVIAAFKIPAILLRNFPTTEARLAIIGAWLISIPILIILNILIAAISSHRARQGLPATHALTILRTIAIFALIFVLAASFPILNGDY